MVSRTAQPIPQLQPDGQISCDSYFHFVQSPSKKYFCFSEMQITAIFASVPSHQKGRIMIVANAGRDAVDARSATDESASCGR